MPVEAFFGECGGEGGRGITRRSTLIIPLLPLIKVALLLSPPPEGDQKVFLRSVWLIGCPPCRQGRASPSLPSRGEAYYQDLIKNILVN